MKNTKVVIVICILLAILLAMFLLYEPMVTPIKIKGKVKDYGIGNIMGDNDKYLIALTGGRWNKFGNDVVIYSIENNKEIYREDFTEYKPWKIVVGDIDGDKIDEISIGVYKTSPLHLVMAKRPFIYSFKNNKLEPKWKGSRLSKPFKDYLFFDIDKDGIDEIVAIEILKNEKNTINTYKWKGFGFEVYMETEGFEDIDKLRIEGDKLYMEVKNNRKRYKGILVLVDYKLKIERVD